jgi:polyferredoxin
MGKVKQFIHKWVWFILLLFCGLGIVYPVIGLAAIVCMLGPSVYALIKNGRGWCGTYCPRGSFNDIIVPRISFKNRIPMFLKTPWFRLLFLTLLMTAFGIQMVFAWGSISAVGMVFVRMILVTTALTLILGVVFKPRTWCTFCPMGTLAYYVTKWKTPARGREYVTFDKESCTNCSSCSKTCPMNVNVQSHKEVGRVVEPDCIKCGMCVAKCPKNILSLSCTLSQPSSAKNAAVGKTA